MFYVLASLLALWVHWSYSRVCFVRVMVWGDRTIPLRSALNVSRLHPEFVFGLPSTQSGHFVDWFLRGLLLAALWVMFFINLDLAGRDLSSEFYQNVRWGVAYAFSTITIGAALIALWDLHANAYRRFVRESGSVSCFDDVLDGLSRLVVTTGWFSLVVAINYVMQPTEGVLQLWWGVVSMWAVLFLIKICSVPYGRAKRWRTQSSN